MGLFQHPHLTRGIVHTPKGGFVVSRGLVELPDDIGEEYGWRRVDDEDGNQPTVAGSASIPGATMRGPRAGGSHEPYSS